MRQHGALLAAPCNRKGKFHDNPSTTDDRRHAGTEHVYAYPGLLSPASVAQFARYFGKSPDKLSIEDIRTYQVYLTNERKLAPASIHVAVAGLRFFYRVTLKKRMRAS